MVTPAAVSKRLGVAVADDYSLAILLDFHPEETMGR
jgi:hypothetical protein